MEVAKEKSAVMEEFDEDDVASRRCMLDGESNRYNALNNASSNCMDLKNASFIDISIVSDDIKDKERSYPR
ncbi:hypothetical protein SFRURICE_017538 [Spodoptera frugiperda]|uniref:SFRICE_027949 n=1 Tax=Spodoptera frugiperda TaxID=7108 RepID=A0A2H1WLI0_SPOFR|nr:hypothetical protein SFRURICE_017538 [Spodoptera frugiperda]